MLLVTCKQSSQQTMYVVSFVSSALGGTRQVRRVAGQDDYMVKHMPDRGWINQNLE